MSVLRRRWKRIALAASVSILVYILVSDGDVFALDTEGIFLDTLSFQYNSSEGLPDETPPRSARKRKYPPFQTKLCDDCFQRNFTELHYPTDVCDSGVNLIMLVLCKPDDFAVREALRGSYLRWTLNNTSPYVRYVFLVGSTKDDAVQRKIAGEFSIKGDIVQQDFLDAYNHLTLKVIMGLEWATRYCQGAKYVMKVDADVYVNVHKVYSKIVKRRKKYGKAAALGNCIMMQHKARHFGNGKWTVPWRQYNGTTYPPYCQGPAYLLTMNATKDVVNISPNVPFLKLEDVWVGMALRALNYPIRHIEWFESHTGIGKSVTVSSFNCQRLKRPTTSHNSRPIVVKQVWDKCYEPNLYPVIR